MSGYTIFDVDTDINATSILTSSLNGPDIIYQSKTTFVDDVTLNTNVTFNGTLSVPDNSLTSRVLSDGTTIARTTANNIFSGNNTFSGTNTLTGTLAVPDGSFSTNVLSDQATLPRLATDNTFTGTVTFTGNVILGDQTTDTVTIIGTPSFSRNLTLPASLTTPSTGQLGFIKFGTLANSSTDFSLTSNTAADVASLFLPIGVWMIRGQNALTFTSAGTLTQFITSISPTSAGIYNYSMVREDRSVSVSTGGILVREVTNLLTLTSSATYYLVTFATFSSGTVTTYMNNTRLHAIRIA